MTDFDATKYQIMLKGNWFVVLKPIKYEKERLELAQVKLMIEKCQVSLRGWNYPHYHEKGESYGGVSIGEDYIQCITNFKSHIELWRMYQSGQFVHSFICPEDYWDQSKDSNILSILWTLYRITEIYLFASNLAINNVFGETVEIRLELKNMQKRSLAFLDPSRDLHGNYQCQAQKVSYSETLSKADSIASSAGHALSRTRWIFQRFGWFSDHIIELLKPEQERFLEGELRV